MPATYPYSGPDQDHAPASGRSIFILSFHLCLGLPNCLLPSGFPTTSLHTLLLSPIRATCRAHLILLDFIVRKTFGEEYRTLSSPLCSFLQTLSRHSGSSKWSVSLRFPHHNPVYASPVPHTCYIPRQTHSSRFNHPNNIR